MDRITLHSHANELCIDATYYCFWCVKLKANAKWFTPWRLLAIFCRYPPNLLHLFPIIPTIIVEMHVRTVLYGVRKLICYQCRCQAAHPKGHCCYQLMKNWGLNLCSNVFDIFLPGQNRRCSQNIRFVPRLFFLLAAMTVTKRTTGGQLSINQSNLLMVKLATGLTKTMHTYKDMVCFWKKEPWIAWGCNPDKITV